MKVRRLSHHPGQIVDASKKLTFDFDGRSIEACEGDTVASALYAAGVRIFSRSFKYHRPRGLLCVSGNCPNCLMEVDGIPNVRACTMTACQSMEVRHQNAWPSLNHDMLSILDKMDRFLPVGFYYKSLIRPRFLWHLAEPIIRRLAGLGKIDPNATSRNTYEHKTKHADLVIIGAGPSGVAAALEAAGRGVDVTLIDNQEAVGGHLRYQRHIYPDLFEFSGLKGFEIAGMLAEAVMSEPGIDALLEATAVGIYEGNLLAVVQHGHLIKVRAKEVIVATGSQEIPLVFQNNDRPGTFLGTAVQRLMHLYGVRPGDKALVVTSNDHGYTVAKDLADAGIQLLGIVDARAGTTNHLEEEKALKEMGVAIMVSSTIVRAKGTKHVKGAVVARLDEQGNPVREEKHIDCDLIVLSPGFEPTNSLLYQQGCKLTYDPSLGEVVPTELSPGMYAAGDVTGIYDIKVGILQGRLAGLEATASIGRETVTDTSNDVAECRNRLTEAVNGYREQLHPRLMAAVPGAGKKKFVCVCEDVTEKDLQQAIYEGFEDIQSLKRYSTVTMGPCQGKMCSRSSIGIAARETGESIPETGTTTSRPPVQPTPLGLLAGPGHLPVKMSALEHKQRAMGAQMINLGQWRRPFCYTSPQEEALAVHQRVGIIDVSSLGKLDVMGKDAPALLDKVYTHIFSNLGIGRIRYGVMCSDSGTIIDDGTVSRLAEDHYFITTTTGNVELIEQWIKWWAAGTGMCAHLTDVTSAFAAINVAGPKARDTLSKLTDVDLSTNAFRYMRTEENMVAGVPARLLRIGFVGEMGWEIHFPVEYAEYMWDTLMEAGKEFGITPFGMEAQRILRLEKKHIIVGQDTDAVSNPLESDMEWVVRFEKDDFIGRKVLQSVHERGLRDKLVGFLMDDSRVPKEGVPVVLDGRPVGRVTSSRLSPTLARGYGLAWVPVQLAEEGEEIHIRMDGKTVPARVVLQPFYDPEGTHLRE